MAGETIEGEGFGGVFDQNGDTLSRLMEEFQKRERRGPEDVLPTRVLQRRAEAFLEKVEGGRSKEEDQAFIYPLLHFAEQLYLRETNFRLPKDLIIGEFGAEPAPANPEWYINVDPLMGFQRKPIDVERIIFRENNPDGTPGKSWSHIEHTMAIRLGSDVERNSEAEKIEKYIDGVFIRLKENSMWDMYFSNIENLPGLAKFYFTAATISNKDLETTYNLGFVGEPGKIESVGGVKFDEERVVGQMQDCALRLYEAIGYSEKKDNFINLTKEDGWKYVIGHSLSEGEKSKIFKEWFGDPSKWVEYGKRKLDEEDDKKNDVKIEEGKGNRGKLTKHGNIFRGETAQNIQEIRNGVVEFLGGGDAAKLAEKLAWRKFRVLGLASQYGNELYLNEKGVLQWMTEMGGDVSDDLVKVINPQAYQYTYARKFRGGGPAGSLGKIKPFAVDVFRGVVFGKEYKLPDGTIIGRDISMRELMWKKGLRLGDIDYGALPERPLVRPYLSVFMAGKGKELGGGSFDKMTDEDAPPSPDILISPGTWHGLWKALDVGITPAVVFLGDMEKFANDPNRTETVRQYKLNQVRAFLDGILSMPIIRKWDSDKEAWRGTDLLGRTSSSRIVEIANVSIPDLNYKKR